MKKLLRIKRRTISPALSYWLPILLLVPGVARGVELSKGNSTQNPTNVQALGFTFPPYSAATPGSANSGSYRGPGYSMPGGYDGASGMLIFDFPDATKPRRPVATFDATFRFGLDQGTGVPRAGWISGLTFNYGAVEKSYDNPKEAGLGGGLTIALYNRNQPTGTALLQASYRGQILFGPTNIPLAALSWMNVSYTPTNGLKLGIFILGQATNVFLSGRSLDWDPAADWRFSFGGWQEAGYPAPSVDLPEIIGLTAPYIPTAIANRSSYQDFSDAFEFDLDTLEGQPENVQVTATTSNPAVFAGTNLTVTVISPTRRRITLSPKKGGYGTNVVTLHLDPGSGGPVGTATYQHAVIQNVPPTIEAVPAIVQPHGFTHVRPIQIGSAHWPLDQLSMTVDSVPTNLLDPRTVFVLPLDGNPSHRTLNFTPRPDGTGTGDIVIRVTDPSGDSSTSRVTVTTVVGDQPPVALGAGTALSLNTASPFGQYAVDYNGLPADRLDNATLEAWVLARSLPDPTFNFVVFLGQPAVTRGLVLGVQADGTPSLANYVNDFAPTNALRKMPLNEWHHIAAVLSGTSVSLYLDGQVVATGNVPALPNVAGGHIFVGGEPLGGLNRLWRGHIDEVRIWNTARTAEEIAASYNQAVRPDAPGLLRYYRFEEGFLHFDGGPGGSPGAANYTAARLVDSSVNQRPLVAAVFPAFVPGVPLTTQVDVEQNSVSSLGMATIVTGTNAWGSAGVVREIFFGPDSTLLASGLGASPGWPTTPIAIHANGLGLEVAPGGPSNYGERIRGYLLPPETGTYSISIASANEGQLFLSTDSSAANLKQIAYSPPAGVSFRQFDAVPAQQTATVTLTAGQRYYLEVRHQAGTAGGVTPHLSVQWTLPNGSVESPLPAYRIQPLGTPPSDHVEIDVDLAPAWGSLAIGTNTVNYTALPNYFGPDDFVFRARYGTLSTPPANVKVNVLNRDPRPVAGSGNALYLNGTSSSVERVPGFDLGSGSFTVETWAQRANTNPGLQALFSYLTDPSTNRPQATFGWFGSGNAGLQMTSTLPQAELLSSAEYLDTNWHHWAAVFDASTGSREIFRDGISLGSLVSSNAAVGSGNLYVGSVGGTSGFFQGSLDDFRLWNRARSRQEILATMNTPLTGNEDNLLVYYRFDEGNGLIAYDSARPKSGNVRFDGTILNPVRWTNGISLFGQVVVPRNSPGQKIFLPGLDFSQRTLAYQITGQPQNGGLKADPLQPGVYTYTPQPGYYGADTIRYKVSAGGSLSAEATLLVNVAFIAIPPTISSIRDQEFEEEDPALVVAFTVTDPDQPDGKRLTFTARTSNPTLLPVQQIVFGGSGTSRTVTLDPIDGEVGTATIEIEVNNGATPPVSTSFGVRVNPRLAFAVINVGDVTKQPSSYATALNAGGQVAGYVAGITGQTNSSGFFYTGYGLAAQAIVFPNLGGPTGGALDVNASGLIVGAATDGQNATLAFAIDPRRDARPTALGVLPGGNLSVATAVNDAGLIVGYAETGDGTFRAFTTGSDGGLAPLSLTNGFASMWATAVNGVGEIAGYARVATSGATNGFLYAAGQTQDLGRPAGADHVVITALSDQGLVVGHAHYSSGARSRIATYLDGTWTDLGDMLGGGAAEPFAVNRFGQIVGRAQTTNGLWHAFLYTDGRAIDLNALTRNSDWSLTDARAINERAQIAANGVSETGANQALLLFPATEIGRRVFRPEGTIGEMPQITILQGAGTDQPGNSFFWSASERKLFAIRPVVADIRWRTGTFEFVTNLTQFGDTAIRQVFTNEVLLPALSFNVWPNDPEIHVAGAPVQTQPDDPSFRHGFIELIYSTADGAQVDGATKVFNSPSSGYSVLHYLRTERRPPNADLQPHYFTVARTIAWNDPAFLVTNVAWSVGQPMTNALHQDYPGFNGYILSTNAYFDGVGPDAAYSLKTRQGPILPVNSNERGEDFVVIWYRQDRIGTAWASLPHAYAVRWPTNAPAIVISSLLGTGPLALTAYPRMQIYDQPDARLAGFNPNEEHALINAGVLYALRNDLNGRINPKASDPYVLLKYLDPISGEWRIEVFGVVAEQPPYSFRYDGIAGREIQAPLPISLLPLVTTRNHLVSGPAWQDYHGKFYARAAGANGGEAEVVLQYFYPLQEGFFYDLDRDGVPDAEVGEPVAWLDHRDGGTLGVPVDVTYSIQWPPDAPALRVGQSLTTATGGLPDVMDMASTQIVFDSLDPTGTRPLGAAARLYDPFSPRAVQLEEDFAFPDGVRRQSDPATGNELFPDLPYYLRVRLYHDPRNHLLAFRGFMDAPSDGSAPILLVNIMNRREREAILALDSSANPEFAEAVEALYNLTRNPNQLDLSGDGLPDESLLIGLTTQVVTNNGVVLTNIARETLSGSKALTSGQPIPSEVPRDIPGVRFEATQGMTVTNLYGAVTNNFTLEFWVRPEGSRPETPEANTGISGQSGQPYAVYPDHGTEVSGRSDQTAVGISVGTNGVSVFEHASGRLYSPLVHSTPLTGWHHVAVVYRDAQPILYIDGVLARVGLRSSYSVRPSAGLGRIATSWGGYGNFTGSIGDLRLWNYPRAQLAIQGNRNIRLSGTEAGLVGLWRFEETTGALVADASPRANPGLLADSTERIVNRPTVPAGGRYIVIAENNDPSLGGLPVGLHVIRIDEALAHGSLALIESDNVLDERVTLRHTADFAGQPDSFVFQWYYQTSDVGVITDADDLIPFPTDPESGVGVNDITLGTGGQSSLLTLSDGYYVMRYGVVTATGQTNWSGWIGDPSAPESAPRAMFVPGWIKRVLGGINLFAQRSSDFLDNAPNTLASTIAEAGARYEGDVALNPAQLDGFGLIEIYSTVLNRGRTLSIDGNPPVDFQPADDALLLAAGRIADLYLIHADEAFADSADPTIGLTTDSTELGSIASSVFAFQNQLDSLLEEELALLRGRDDRFAGVAAAPVYNRLLWNFTGSDGEVAYVAKYGIPDQNSDGFINAGDAKILFPQGHGDAWGHYLTALTTYYDLLRHPRFNWVPRAEETLVAGIPIEVSYQDERRFARAAAARARTGAEIIDRTYRLEHADDPAASLRGFADPDQNRAWGVSEWGRRAAQGAYFDWVIGNAILPAVDPDPSHVGIQKVDRTTVGELMQIVTESEAALRVLDQANAGLSPLGFARGVVPFDIDPDVLRTGFTRITHFEQIYDRALRALQNAEATFNRVTLLSSELRKQQNSVSDYSVAVANQERAYLGDLIAIFGYPYAGDIGPGGAYSAGYQGPDLTHWMYIDTLDVTPANNPAGEGLGEIQTKFQSLSADWAAAFSTETLDALNPASTNVMEVEFPVSAAAYAFQSPSSWGTRRAEGSLQTALREVVLAQAQLRQSLVAYDNLIKEMEEQAELMSLRYGLRKDQLALTSAKVGLNTTFNALIAAAKGGKIVLEGVVEDFDDAFIALTRAIPEVVGLSNDAFFSIKAALLMGKTFSKGITEKIAEGLEILEIALDFAKEETELGIELSAETNEQNFEVTERLKELEALVRQEAPLRLDLFNARQNLLQAARTLESTLSEGQRLLVQRTLFRQVTAGTIQAARYRDLGLRIFSNDSLQKYEAQFELAARYVQLAAAAYDYELNLGDAGGAGSVFGEQLVRERNLGELVNGDPVVGRVGLASMLGRMRQNFDVLKGQLGLNNDRPERSRFSLRTEAFRILPAASGTNVNTEATANWRELLQGAVVSNLWEVPEFRRFCRPFTPESAGPQPGIVLRFGTTITSGQNYFGKILGPLDSSYDPSEYSTRIRSAAVWFTGYDSIDLAAKPRVYLVPTGTDRLRSSDGDDFSVRDWQVLDQRIPVPFPIVGSDATAATVYPGLQGTFAAIRRHSAFRAYQDQTFDLEEFNESTRLVGRSVWNTQWVLIIPGAYLLGDANAGIDQFVQSVDDIKLYFQTYSASGN